MNTEFEQVTTPQAEQDQAFSVPAPKETDETIGFWVYFGLIALFAVPVIGFIAAIVFMFTPQRKSMKNFARATFAWMIVRIVAAILSAVMLIGVLGSFILPVLNGQFGTQFGNLFEIVGLADDLKNGNYSALINQFRNPILDAIGEEYAPLIDEFATGKYDELIEDIKEKDYNDVLEDLQEGKYQGLVDQLDPEEYKAFKDELQKAANGQSSELFDGIQGYLNDFSQSFPIG